MYMNTRKIITLTIQTTLTKIWFYNVVNWKSTISVSIRKGYFLQFELNNHLRGSVGEILKSVGTWTRPALEVLPDVTSKWVSTIFVIGHVWASLWGHAVSPKQRAVRSPRGRENKCAAEHMQTVHWALTGRSDHPSFGVWPGWENAVNLAKLQGWRTWRGNGRGKQHNDPVLQVHLFFFRFFSSIGY